MEKQSKIDYENVLIISGGALNLDFLKSFISSKSFYIIAADSGLDACLKLNIKPDTIIGDFDSIKEIDNPAKDFPDSLVITLNPIKDDTDTEAAINYCLNNTRGDIYLLGATGTRLDHTISNIYLIYNCLKYNRSLIICDEHNKIYGKNKSFFIKKTEQYGNFVSFFPLFCEIQKLTLKGFFYELCDTKVDGKTSLCVSNEIVDEYGYVSFSDGTLLVIESCDEALL